MTEALLGLLLIGVGFTFSEARVLVIEARETNRVLQLIAEANCATTRALILIGKERTEANLAESVKILHEEMDKLSGVKEVPDGS